MLQRHLAIVIGTPMHHVSKFEKDEIYPTVESLINLAERMPDVNLHWLITGFDRP